MPGTVCANLGIDILFFAENSHRFVGKTRWTKNATGKYAQILYTGKKYRNIYVYLPR